MVKAALAAALTLLVASMAARAQQGGTGAPPRAVVPVAASTLAANPDPYYGEYVSLIGAVEQSLSRSAFSVDQNTTKSTDKDVLILAPTLTGAVQLNTYVTVLGEVVRFEPDDIARRVKGHTLDLAPGVVEKYRGRPAVLATAVIDAAMVDLAKVPLPPMTAEEEAFSKVMKRVGPAFAALRKVIEGSNAEAAREQTDVLKQAFTETAAFWKTRRTADAAQWAQDARTLVESVDRAAAAGTWDDVKASAASLGQMCQKCHAAYRERFDDGTYRIKMGTNERAPRASTRRF
jgi:cytochrome c556